MYRLKYKGSTIFVVSKIPTNSGNALKKGEAKYLIRTVYINTALKVWPKYESDTHCPGSFLVWEKSRATPRVGPSAALLISNGSHAAPESFNDISEADTGETVDIFWNETHVGVAACERIRLEETFTEVKENVKELLERTGAEKLKKLSVKTVIYWPSSEVGHHDANIPYKRRKRSKEAAVSEKKAEKIMKMTEPDTPIEVCNCKLNCRDKITQDTLQR